MWRSKKFWLIIIILSWAFWYLKFADHYPSQITLRAKPDFWGLTFSPKFAASLGLDWKQVYIAVLDDLSVDYIRIPIYWDQIEKSDNEYDFSDYDFIFAEGTKRDVKFIANIGWRLPRWPECHTPTWANSLSDKDRQKEILDMLERVVTHYRAYPAIASWQIENEPLLDSFGICPDGDYEFLQKEVQFVRSLDQRPVIISASGELSNWSREAKLGDIFGTTMYRVVWNPIFGYFRYPTPDWFYQLKAKRAQLERDKVIVSELQAEPWVPSGTLADPSFVEHEKSFDLEQFRANLQFAIDVDFKQAYLWGVEWWYLRNLAGDSSYWDLARSLFVSN